MSWSYGGYTSENREDVEFELWCMIVLERDIYTVFWIVAYASGNSLLQIRTLQACVMYVVPQSYVYYSVVLHSYSHLYALWMAPTC